MNFSQDVLFLSSRFLVDNDDRGGPGISIPVCLEEKKVRFLVILLRPSVIKKIAYLVLTAHPHHRLPSVHYEGKLLELFTALKRVHFRDHRFAADVLRTTKSVKLYLQKVWKDRNAEPPHVSHAHEFGFDDRDTMIWLVDSGVLDVSSDGIRKVEWGFRKDLWVPRAKKGSGTLQKIG